MQKRLSHLIRYSSFKDWRPVLLAGILTLGFAAGAAETELTFPVEYLIDPGLVKELTEKATADSFPDADVVLLADRTRVKYQPDGRAIEWNEEYRKVLTEKGRRSARTRSFGYMAQYSRLAILQATVIREDGRRVEVDLETASRETIDASQMGSNIYDPNHKVITLTIPELAPGDVTRLVIVREIVKPRVPDTWSDYTVMEYTSPIMWIDYGVHAPPERPLKTIRLRDETEGRVSYREERDEAGTWHLWLAQDIPQVFREPNMPPLHRVVQRLLVSTVEDWRDISRWYWKLCEPRLAAINDAMRKDVQERTEGVEKRAEKIRRIFDFVSRDIRYMGLTIEEDAPGYEPHDVCLTFDNRYGVCRDKAALLVAMLRLADIAAYPVLIHAGARMDPDVPLPFFNHAIVAVENEGEGLEGSERYLLMDPTDENTRDLLPGYLHNKSFLVAHPEGETLLDSGSSAAENHLVKISSRGRLDETDRLTLDTEIRFEGVNDNAYRGHFVRLKAEERRRFFEGLARARLAGATLESFELSPEDLRDTAQPLVAKMRSVSADYPLAGEGARLVELPWMGNSIGFANWVLGRTGLEKRRFPLDAEPACGVEEKIEIDLGEKFEEPLVLPGVIDIENEGIVFRQESAFEGGILSAATRFHVKAAEFSPEEYLRLREDRKEMEFAYRRRPIFAPSDQWGEADSRLLLSRTRVALQDSGNWVRETHVRRKILTYAGKKAHAELRIGFNPAWQTVEVVEAKVIMPDGEVREPGEQERNLMDAAWVGSAPRYPAERTLVVNLPGVEVDCEIETVVKVTQTDAPFFSMWAVVQGEEPRDEWVLEIEKPESLALQIIEPEAGHTVELKREREKVGGQTIHRWRASDVAALQKEDDRPPAWAYLPAIIISSGDWSEYGRELERRMEELSSGQAAVEERSRSCIGGAESELEKIRAIRDWVAMNIRAAGPGFTGLPLSALTPADITLKDGYGHKADQAILLLTMLKSAGIEAELMLVGGGAPVLEKLLEPLREAPQRSLYGTMMVRAVSREGEVFWLNDTDQYAEPGTTPLEKRPSMNLRGEHGAVAVEERFATYGEEIWYMDIGEDGTAEITFEKVLHGMDVNSFRREYSEMQPEERLRHQQELVAGIAQAATAIKPLETDVVSYPGKSRLTVKAERYAVREGNLLQLALPGQRGNPLRLRSEKRSQPLYRGMDRRMETKHVVRFPAGVQSILVAPPAAVNFEFPGGLGRTELKMDSRRMEDGRLEVTIVRREDLRSSVAQISDYPSLLAMSRQLQHPRFRTLVVELRDNK